MVGRNEVFLEYIYRGYEGGKFFQTPLIGDIDGFFYTGKADNTSDALDCGGRFSELLNFTKGDGIEDLLTFDDHPDNFVGAKQFFEVNITGGFRQVFDLEIVDRGFKR